MPGGEDGFKPITPDQVTDEKLVAGQLRALQREVRDGFESIAQSLKAFERVDAKLDVIIDRQNVMESRLDVIDKWRAATDVRLAALETKRATRPRKKR